jgi:hypothetical protein
VEIGVLALFLLLRYQDNVSAGRTLTKPTSTHHCLGAPGQTQVHFSIRTTQLALVPLILRRASGAFDHELAVHPNEPESTGLQADQRNHLDLRINLLAEDENTKMLQILQAICEYHKLTITGDPEITAMAKRTESSRSCRS